MKPVIPEAIGKRIARIRQKHGFTQQTLSERLAISRVAVSHIEADLSIPSERTVTLLAGLFKCPPHELVEGTTYPAAKAERLPYIVAMHTPLELEIEILKNDLAWVEKLKDHSNPLVAEIRTKWEKRLIYWELACLDIHERELLAVAWRIVKRD